jgi:hypothetical protein
MPERQANEMTTPWRFYGELAKWWPLISPVEDYADEANEVAELLELASRPVLTMLELGSGGGHCAAHLKHNVRMTLTDLSSDMLNMSRQLNPQCEHIQGDMRTLRLERVFDAIFVHDAIDYMTTRDELKMVMATAFCHCAPGGLAIFMPDDVGEVYEESCECGGINAEDGSGVRYLEWSTDPDPNDTMLSTDYVFILREADGRARTVHETHITGFFSEATWLELLREQGFIPQVRARTSVGDDEGRWAFVAKRPE